MRFWVIAGVFAILGVFLAIQGGIVSDERIRQVEGVVRGENAKELETGQPDA